MANDPNKSPDGNDKDVGKSKSENAWSGLGFADEAEMVEAAKSAKTLKDEIEAKEVALEKERSARTKQSDDFIRQSNEVGTLKKQLKDLEASKDASHSSEEDKTTDEELIESLSTEDATHFDEVLDKPENLELKKAVATGGAKAMAEFIRSFNKNAPLDFKAPVFASLKKKKSDYVAKNSIANMVKSLFEQDETTLKNKVPATSPAGSPSDGVTKTKKVSAIGTVTAGFYDGTKPKG